MSRSKPGELLAGRECDAVLANLPYVAEGAELAPEITRYEPAGALYAGPDGLDIIRRLIPMLARVQFVALRSGVTRAMPSRGSSAAPGSPMSTAGVTSPATSACSSAADERPRAGRPDNSSELFERCLSVGGVAVFPADTVYGLACDPSNRIAVERLYRLKRRSLAKPSAVMFFDASLALDALPELGERTRAALLSLLPGGVSLLLPNPVRRFPLACGDDPGTLGLRVPVVPLLAGVKWPVLQSSANLAGEPDARRLSDVPQLLRDRCRSPA